MFSSQLARIRDHHARVAALTDAAGPDDPCTLDARVHLADTYLRYVPEADDPHEWAERGLAELALIVESRTRTAGPEDPGTLEARRLLLEQRGLHDDESPVSELEAFATTWERVFGFTHPETTVLWNRVAFHRAGTDRAAIHARLADGWRQALADGERQFGPDHPDTLEARRQLLAHDGESRRAEIVAGWGRLAAERAGRLGPAHPSTVEARTEHAGWSDSNRLFDEIAADLAGVLGPSHPRTWRARFHPAYRRAIARPAHTKAAEQVLAAMYSALDPDYVHVEKLGSLLVDRPDPDAVAGFVAVRLLRAVLGAAGPDVVELHRRYPLPDDPPEDDEEE
ncbi:hypothetical protein [Actinoplanes sp. NPDC020271]|uniref:hypothetical protein n=1 Tax=Actinoplanes sp. NPDC020271 TaxID=3363896 RepID=UPI0037B1EDC1